MVELGWNNSRTRVGVAELSAGRVAWARNAEAMSRLGNDSDFYFFSNRWFSPTLKSIPFIHRLPGLSSAMFDDGRRCSTMFGDVRRCSAMFDDVRRCSAMFDDVRRCSTMFGEVRRGSARFGDVIRCSAMFGDVRRCSTMFGDVRRCSAMFDDVRRCSAMFGDIIRCSAILSELQFTIVTVGSFSTAKRPRERISSSGRVTSFGRESMFDHRSCCARLHTVSLGLGC